MSIHYDTPSYDIRYECALSRPAFEVASQNVQIMEAIYDRVTPRFPVSLADFRSFGGNSLADVSIRMGAFQNRANLVLVPDRYTISFSHLSIREDLLIVRDFTELVEAALADFVPAEKVSSRMVNAAVHLKILGDEPGPFFDPLVSERGAMAPGELGATSVDHGLVISAENTEEEWSAAFHFQRSILDIADLFLSCSVTFHGAAVHHSVGDRFARAESLYDAFLRRYDLEPGA